MNLYLILSAAFACLALVALLVLAFRSRPPLRILSRHVLPPVIRGRIWRDFPDEMDGPVYYKLFTETPCIEDLRDWYRQGLSPEAVIAAELMQCFVYCPTGQPPEHARILSELRGWAASWDPALGKTGDLILLGEDPVKGPTDFVYFPYQAPRPPAH